MINVRFAENIAGTLSETESSVFNWYVRSGVLDVHSESERERKRREKEQKLPSEPGELLFKQRSAIPAHHSTVAGSPNPSPAAYESSFSL